MWYGLGLDYACHMMFTTLRGNAGIIMLVCEPWCSCLWHEISTSNIINSSPNFHTSVHESAIFEKTISSWIMQWKMGLNDKLCWIEWFRHDILLSGNFIMASASCTVYLYLYVLPSMKGFKFPLFCSDNELCVLLPSYIHGTCGAYNTLYSIFMISDEVCKWKLYL
jgi:hypothetical protein